MRQIGIKLAYFGNLKGIWSPNHLEWIETQVGFESDDLKPSPIGCQHQGSAGRDVPGLSIILKTFKFAAAKAGLILVNVNPSYTANELAFVLDKCKIKTIICDNKYRKKLKFRQNFGIMNHKL